MIDKSIEEIRKLKVDDLKVILRSEGASIVGKKADLIDRLEQLISEQKESSNDTGDGDKQNSNECNYWVKEDSQPPVESTSSANAGSISFPEEPKISEGLPISNSPDEKGELNIETQKIPSKSVLQRILETDDQSELVDYDEVPQPVEESTNNDENEQILEAPQETQELQENKSAETLDEADDIKPIVDAKLLEEKELKYRLLALKSKKQRDLSAPVSSKMKIQAPVSVKKPIHEPSRFVRIDNLQRPLTLRGLRTWLEENLQMDIPESSIWLNNIKTHCYIEFETVEQAKNCIECVSGKVYPDTNSALLEADYTNVSASNAATSEEGKLKPGEWKKTQKLEIDTSVAKGNNADAAVRTSPRPTLALDAVKKAAVMAVESNRTKTVSKVPSSRRPEFTQEEPQVKRQRTENKNSYESVAFEQIKHPKPESLNRLPENKKSEESNETVEISLETLFRKTKAEPSIYWLPLPKQVAEKRLLEIQSNRSTSVK